MTTDAAKAVLPALSSAEQKKEDGSSPETTAVSNPDSAPAVKPSPAAAPQDAPAEIPVEDKLARVSLTDNPVPSDSLPTTKSPVKKAPGEENKKSTDQRRSVDKKGAAVCEVPGEENLTSFHGEVNTNNELPSQETIDRIGDYIVLDRHGKTHPFKSLYTGKNVARRVLVVFVRHFFCGQCQEYLQTLSATITPDSLLNLPISTFVAVIGCGAPELIDMYIAATNCQFPIYTDPTRKLYEELGMVRTLSLGSKPAYVRKSLVHSMVSSVGQGVKQMWSGLATKGGDQKQVGGEFMFEPYTLATPIDEMPESSPFGVSRKFSVGFNSLGDGTRHEDVTRERNGIEEKRVSWCHRMRSTRDHAEIPELMEVLGLNEDGTGPNPEALRRFDKKRWSKAKSERKGTGLSMASEMSRMSKELEGVESLETKTSN